MKMQKRVLQIQTNFLEEDQQQSQPIVTTSKINYQQKLQAATLFQKSLSMILARNFIQCWKELKDYEEIQLKVRTQNKTRAGKRRIQKNSQYVRQQRYQSVDVQNLNLKNNKPRSQSQAFRYLKTQRSSDVHQEEYRIKRNKSVRVINQEVQNSRASILQSIVQKLKNVRKTNDQLEEHENNIEVLNRISNLQKLIKGMKGQNKSEIHIYKTNQHHNYQHSYENKHQHHYTPQEQQNTEQDELVKQFIQQIQIIRKQVTQIKANNQLILKAQLQRSQVSQNSNRQRNQVQQANNGKGMVSQGSQTIQPVQIVVEKQPTLAEIEQKHKKLVQEVSILSKAMTMPGTVANNGSYLGVSGVDSQKSQKVLANQFTKYANLNSFDNPISYEPTKTSPLTSVFPTSSFPQIPKNTNPTTFYNPITTTIPTSIPSMTPSNPTYSFQQQPPTSNFSFSQPIPISQSIPISQPIPISQSIVQPPPISLSRPPNYNQNLSFEYPKYDKVRTTTTFDSRNNISFNSNSQIGRNFQPTFTLTNSSNNSGINVNLNSKSHLRNPSIQIYQQTKKNVFQFSNYCSNCGRNCGCPRAKVNFGN